MIGTVQQISGTHATCQLSAAEGTLRLPLSMVSPCSQRVTATTYYVVVNKKIKEVRGLLLPTSVDIPDYHKTREEADRELVEIIRKNPRPTATTETLAEPVNADATSHLESSNASTTTSTGPSTPVTQIRKRTGRRGRRRRKAVPLATPANDTRVAPTTDTRAAPLAADANDTSEHEPSEVG